MVWAAEERVHLACSHAVQRHRKIPSAQGETQLAAHKTITGGEMRWEVWQITPHRRVQ